MLGGFLGVLGGAAAGEEGLDFGGFVEVFGCAEEGEEGGEHFCVGCVGFMLGVCAWW